MRDVPGKWLKVAGQAWDKAVDDTDEVKVALTAVLAAVAPLIAARERERCEQVLADLVLTYPSQSSAWDALIEGAAAIRATPEGEK